jgi:predicted Zn-dependent protease
MTAKSHSRTRSTWEGRPTRDFTDIAMADVDASIRQRLAWQERTSAYAPGRHTTVVPSGAMADLMAYILWTSSGRDAYEGRSVFAKKGAPGTTRVGELLASLPVNIFADPSYPGLETAPFIVATESNQFTSVFDNGETVPRFDLVHRGHLDSLITSRASSARTGLDFAPVGGNMITELPGATGDLSALVADVDTGLLVTTFWYIRTVDPTTYLLTGLTRDGVYEIRHGEVIGAVNNFRWNESPVDLLSRITAVGATEITATRELEQFMHTAAPAVVFRDFNMSTVSQAN